VQNIFDLVLDGRVLAVFITICLSLCCGQGKEKVKQNQLTMMIVKLNHFIIRRKENLYKLEGLTAPIRE
jgi:hypothetical protein